MTAKDQLKLLDAGFTIIRMEGRGTFSDKRIKYKNKEQRGWATLVSGFKSNSAMQKRVTELLKISTIVED